MGTAVKTSAATTTKSAAAVNKSKAANVLKAAKALKPNRISFRDDPVKTNRTGFLDHPGTERAAERQRIGMAALVVVGAISGLQLAGYTLTGVSVVCLFLAPAYLFMFHRGVDLLPLALAILGGISFVASCFINDVSLLWANVFASTAFALYLVGFTVLTGRSIDRIAMVLAGLGAGTIIFFASKGIALTNTGNLQDVWKYGIAPGATVILVVTLVTMRIRPVWQSAVLFLLGLASLGLNYRSHALVCFLSAAILLSQRIFGSRIKRGWIFVGILAFGQLFSYLLPIVGRSGLFGAALQAKSIQQDTDMPLLLAGRTEPPMSLTAIAEHPLLGWGSATKLTPDVYARSEHLAVDVGYPPTFPFEGYWRLPATDYSAMHSILLGSWAEGGILSALLPAWLLVASVAMVWNNQRFGKWAALALVVALQAIWDLLFAPWTYNMVPMCACIALLFCATHFRGRLAGP
jgi:hypothetical protein